MLATSWTVHVTQLAEADLADTLLSRKRTVSVRMSSGNARTFFSFLRMTSAIALMSTKFSMIPSNHLASSHTRLMSSVPVQPVVDNFNYTGKSVEQAKTLIATYFPLATLPTVSDMEVIEARQSGRPARGTFAVENTRCKYGFPQAFMQYPVGKSVSSGMIRLSCPHLVKAVDEFEAEGGLDTFDSMLANEAEDGTLRSSFHSANLAWIAIRKDSVSTKDRDYMQKKLGIEGSKFLMESGIIGCTVGKIQVKCLHAHIADHLVRGTNEIGAQALEELTKKGKKVSSLTVQINRVNPVYYKLLCVITVTVYLFPMIGFITEKSSLLLLPFRHYL